MPATSFKQRKTPGVYITELDAFPPSIVGVQTAVPAFIGYTEKAEINGKPIYNKPIKVNSMADYEAIFGKGYKKLYDIEEVAAPADDNWDFRVFDSSAAPPEYKYYALADVNDTRFALYASMLLFYANGGGPCYVVSVAPYVDPGSSTPNTIDKGKLETGLDAIGEQVGPTMLVVPDAVLLAPDAADPVWVSAAFKSVVDKMLTQCGDLQDRVAILDVYGSQAATKDNLYVDPTDPTKPGIITQFQKDVGDKYLNYGMAYFPFLVTTVYDLGDFDYTSINIGDAAQLTLLQDVLKMQNTDLNSAEGVLTPRGVLVEADIAKIAPDNTEEEVQKLNQNLTAALPVLKEIENDILAMNSTLPTSPAMAGVYTFVDQTRGVWNAPANISLSAVSRPTFKLNDEQQGNLNLPVNGKAVDAIREFTGRGSVVWGARTLDGNSNDWRYIQVRRTLIYVEQSIKAALDPFVFAANDGNTWVTVVSMVSNFLQGLWSQGGLMGATASEAYSVECGLGSTMTAQDVLEGYMIVQVVLQMIHPAEFIELTFKQKMQG